MTLAVTVMALVLFYTGSTDVIPVRSWVATPNEYVPSPVAQQTPPPERTVNQQTRDALLALAMGLAIFSSSLALGIAYGIRRRIDQIAGPPDYDDDD